jgi:hypothetical protein
MMGNVVAARSVYPPFLGAGWSQIATAAPGLAIQTATQAGLITAGSALSVALPGVGIAIAIIIGSLFAAHAKRVAGAKQENTILNSLIPTVQQAVSAVFDALNNGTTTPQDAASALDQISQQYWQAASQVEHGPGQAGGQGTCSSRYADSKGAIGAPCNKDCTASCCIGCGWVENWVGEGKKIISAGGGSKSWPAVPGNSYGLQTFPGLSVTYTPPPPGSVAALASGSGLLSGSVMGIPIWMLLAGLVAWKVLA